MFGVPGDGDIDYSQVVEVDLGTVAPSLAGPKRPQDRIELGAGARGPITEKIQSAFFDIVNGRNAKYAEWLDRV